MAQSTSFIVAIVKSRAWHKVQCWPSLLWEYNSIGTLPLGIVLYWLLASDRRDKNVPRTELKLRHFIVVLLFVVVLCLGRKEKLARITQYWLVFFLYTYLSTYIYTYIKSCSVFSERLDVQMHMYVYFIYYYFVWSGNWTWGARLFAP